MNIRSKLSTFIPQPKNLLKIILGVSVYVALGQLTHYIRNPMLPAASLALNMVVPVVIGYCTGSAVGGLVGGLGTLANFLVKWPIYGPDLYELMAVLPHALMGAVAGWSSLRDRRAGVAFTILIGHILNLIVFVAVGLINITAIQDSSFWLGLMAEGMVDLIVILMMLTVLEYLRGGSRQLTWQYIGWARFLLLGILNFLLIFLLLIGYEQKVLYIDYFLILSVIFVALTLGFMEAWLSALLISLWIGQRVISRGLPIGTRETVLILVLNTTALIVGNVVSNLRRQRRLNRLRLEELQEAYGVLSQADHLKDQMIQNISHELRTPLSMILGYTELLVDDTWGTLTDAQREAAEVMRRNAQRLAEIVEKVTVLDRVEGGRMTRHPTSIEILTQNLLTSWRKKPQSQSYELKLNVEGEIQPVSGDARYLRLAVEALLDNAIKFSPEGSTITSRIWMENHKIYFAVEDSGIGIRSEDQALLFQRFYQVDGTTTRRFAGLGTGLALVKEVVYLHGGDVWVESEEGKGSVFGFWIPLDGIPSATQENMTGLFKNELF